MKKEQKEPLQILKSQIEEAKKRTRQQPSSKPTSSTTIKQFLAVGTEFISGILAGVAGGLFIDWAFGSSPWGLISLFILGSAAGFLNVYRVLSKAVRKV